MTSRRKPAIRVASNRVRWCPKELNGDQGDENLKDGVDELLFMEFNSQVLIKRNKT